MLIGKLRHWNLLMYMYTFGKAFKYLNLTIYSFECKQKMCVQRKDKNSYKLKVTFEIFSVDFYFEINK